MNEVVQ